MVFWFVTCLPVAKVNVGTLVQFPTFRHCLSACLLSSPQSKFLGTHQRISCDYTIPCHTDFLDFVVFAPLVFVRCLRLCCEICIWVLTTPSCLSLRISLDLFARTISKLKTGLIPPAHDVFYGDDISAYYHWRFFFENMFGFEGDFTKKLTWEKETKAVCHPQGNALGPLLLISGIGTWNMNQVQHKFRFVGVEIWQFFVQKVNVDYEWREKMKLANYNFDCFWWYGRN